MRSDGAGSASAHGTLWRRSSAALSTSGDEAEIDSVVPRPGLLAAHRPAGWLWGGGRRHAGVLEEGRGDWIFHPLGSSALGRLSSAARLELELRADGRWRRRLSSGRFQILDFEVDAAARQVRFRPPRFEEEKARLFPVLEELPVTVIGPSLFHRVLAGDVESISPLEIVAAVRDDERLLFPGAMVQVEAGRPSSRRFRIYGRVASLERRDQATRLYLRLTDRASVEEASLLAACECRGFGTHTMWTYGFAPRGLGGLLRVRQAATVEDMTRALELRREANQFYGRLPEAGNWRSWSDPWDETSLVVLVSLGAKAVATGRLVVNGGDRGRSEIEQSVGLPGFLWSASFVEASELAVHPAFRGSGLRLSLCQEIARLALSLGSRFIVVAAIAPLIPLLEEMGAISLALTKRCRRSGEEEHVLYFDVQRLLLGIGRASIRSQAAFGPTLGSFLSTCGAGEIPRLLGGRLRWSYRVKSAIARAQARRSEPAAPRRVRRTPPG
jgi:hypothetical protein